MSSRKNGGPAFPRPASKGEYGEAGMSLRDWFAGQALYALIKAGYTRQLLATTAYEIADALIARREDPK